MVKPSTANSMLALAAFSFACAFASAQPACETILYNGKITTMDAKNTEARSITLRGDRISSVANGTGVPQHERCAQLIDLKGRRVVPGLIDSHNHIVQVALRPGHDVRLDLATSIADVQYFLRERASAVPQGDWISAVDGWSPEQLAEKHMPTLGDLDAAAPNHPVYVQIGFDGPAATNSKGKTFFEQKGIVVAADGSIAINEPTDAAYRALVSTVTFADQKRGAADVMAYAASFGLTMSDDKGGPWLADTPGASGLAEVSSKTNAQNPVTEYNAFLALAREDKMTMRLRIFFYMQDKTPELSFLRARLNNDFPDFGSDWIKVSGIGERIYSGGFPLTAGASSTLYDSAALMIAQSGWAHDEHAMALDDEKAFTSSWERINRQVPLAPLRWCLAHVPGIDDDTLGRLKAMGVGVSLAGSRYTASTPPRIAPKDIPPFRRIVESGVHAGYGSDGGTVSALDPWLHISYMVTGRNSAGQLVAADQTLTRMQALRMYTASQPWFTREDDKLGSIEAGKLADLVVLSKDYLDPVAVPDEEIRRISSVLTIIGGRVVHNTGALSIASPNSN
jgi:predicted amidohydrolase YtcJ